MATKLRTDENATSKLMAEKKLPYGPPKLTRRPALGEINSINKSIPKIEDKTKDVVTKKNVTVTRTSSLLFKKPELCIKDPDESSRNNPQAVTEYLEDIFAYLREVERKYAVCENFLDKHQSTPNMRSCLIDWLVQVVQDMAENVDTWFLCIWILDKYLTENKSVDKSNLQLVGATSFLIAAKYEEIYFPSINDLILLCDNSFEHWEFIKMEMSILKTLNFSLNWPLPIQFFRRYCKIGQASRKQYNLGKYLLELYLFDYETCHYLPSLGAAAAYYLSYGIINEQLNPQTIWNPTLIKYTTYKYVEFKNVVVKLAKVLLKVKQIKYQNIYVKYTSSNYDKISLLVNLNSPILMLMSKK